MAGILLRDIAAYSDLESMSEDEICAFFRDIDRDNDAFVTFDELEAKLEQVYEELAPVPQKHHLHHRSRRHPKRDPTDGDAEAVGCREHDGLQAFLRVLMPECTEKVSKEQFVRRVRAWNIPSPRFTSREKDISENRSYEKRMTWYRRARAEWSVSGPRLLFAFGIFALTLGLFLWQGLYYYYNRPVRTAVGWGVVMAKFCAGAIYPLLFFTVLSMCRWFSTLMRRFYWVSRVVDWDLSQSFHMWMACLSLFFATLHALSHLTGTFLTGSRPNRQPAVATLLGNNETPMTYNSFLKTLPGWSGIVSLGLFWAISLCSLPSVRKRSYELFQLAHLLMFPFLGLLCVHGIAQILQHPMLGYWLAVPFLLVILERGLRLIRGFRRFRAQLEILDDETISVTVKKEEGEEWRFRAGQYVFLQVPALSFFQWHPFTISACIGSKLQLHIKTDGDWTEKLRELPADVEIGVGVDGPFGAPAQRFYDFDRSIVVGAGVGVTPFSAILTDMEQHLINGQDPWCQSRRRSCSPSRATHTPSTVISEEECKHGNDGAVYSLPMLPQTESRHFATDHATPAQRRVDFHWTVRDRNHLLWFSSLLNRAHDLSQSISRSKLELNINTHITTRRKNISTHVFRYLLDAYRTRSAPFSALTGLKTRSHFGRPDFPSILTSFYVDEVARMRSAGSLGSGVTIGVFFCGSPALGRVLSDVCAELTARGRAERTYVRFTFMMEVFN